MSIANCQGNLGAFFTSQTKTWDELEATGAPGLHVYGSRVSRGSSLLPRGLLCHGWLTDGCARLVFLSRELLRCLQDPREDDPVLGIVCEAVIVSVARKVARK